jgi:HEAT repeat protein/beta-lactamase regulating signal transducer with metallopeptidase domain
MRAELLSQAEGWLLTYLLHSTLMLGGTWLACRRAVQSPAVREVLWKVALVGGLITASLQMGLGFEPLGGAVALDLSPPAAARAPRHEGRAARPWNGVLVPGPSLPEASPASGAAAAALAPQPAGEPSLVRPAPEPAPAAAVTKRLALPALLLAGWAGCALALFGLYLVQRARAMRRIGPRQPVRDPRLLSLLEALRLEGGVRRAIQLTAAPGLTSPVALGSAEIALPRAALTELDEEQQRSMLAHELAHLARRDPFWLTLGCVLERVFFLQPLNRVARQRMQEAAEFLCDDWAVRRTGSGFSLATCLVKVAEWVDTTPRPVPLAGMAEHRSQLVTRIHRLIEGRTMSTAPRSFWLLAGAAALLGATAVSAPSIAPVRRAHPAVDANVGVPQWTDSTTAFLAAASASDTDTVVTADTAGRTNVDGMARSLHDLERRMAVTRARIDSRQALMAARVEAQLSRTMARTMPRVSITVPGSPALLWGGARQHDTTSIAVPALIQALKDPDVEVRRAAVSSLNNLQDPRAVPGLVNALKDGDPEVRAGAASALGSLQDRRAVPGLIAAMKDSNRDVRQFALSALGSMPDADVPDDAILAAINDSDGDVRREAISLALNRMSNRSDDENAKPDPRYVAAFTRLLADSSADVRQEAVEALGASHLREAPAALLAAARDRNADVRQTVAGALGTIRDPRAVPALKELLQDPNSDVRESAVSALSEIRDRAALEALIGALKSSDAAVRRAAADALGQRED